MNKPTTIRQYRLLDVDASIVQQVLNKIAGGQRCATEASYNALSVREYQDVIVALSHMSPAELGELAQSCMQSINLSINLQVLRDSINKTKSSQQRQQQQMDQARWLIVHGASNQLVFKLCSSLSPDAIKHLRIELDRPVAKGRVRLPVLDTRLSIISDWKSLDHLADDFSRYQHLANLYPTLLLSQLHTVIESQS